MQQHYVHLQRRIKEREEYLKSTDSLLGPDSRQQTELLFMQRQSLEENLRLLTEEVEALSLTNTRILKELKTRNFYP